MNDTSIRLCWSVCALRAHSHRCVTHSTGLRPVSVGVCALRTALFTDASVQPQDSGASCSTVVWLAGLRFRTPQVASAATHTRPRPHFVSTCWQSLTHAAFDDLRLLLRSLGLVQRVLARPLPKREDSPTLGGRNLLPRFYRSQLTPPEGTSVPIVRGSTTRYNGSLLIACPMLRSLRFLTVPVTPSLHHLLGATWHRRPSLFVTARPLPDVHLLTRTTPRVSSASRSPALPTRACDHNALQAPQRTDTSTPVFNSMHTYSSNWPPSSCWPPSTP